MVIGTILRIKGGKYKHVCAGPMQDCKQVYKAEFEKGGDDETLVLLCSAGDGLVKRKYFKAQPPKPRRGRPPATDAE